MAPDLITTAHDGRRVHLSGGGVMTVSPGPDGDATRFGTVAFYAALGRAFVVMCAVIPVLALIEVLDRGTGGELDRLFGIEPRALSGIDGIFLAPLVHADFDHLVS